MFFYPAKFIHLLDHFLNPGNAFHLHLKRPVQSVFLRPCVRPLIMKPRFVNSYITSQKFLWITLKHAQTLLRRNHTSPLLWSTVSKRGTYLADSFLMPKHSCKMYHTRPTKMFTVPLNSRTFNRRSLSTMLWILSIISWEVTSFGRPGRSASLMNHAMRWSRLLIISCELFFSFFYWFSSWKIMFNNYTKLAFFHGFLLTMKN